MPYLSKILGTQVVDADGEKIGAVQDLGAAIGEVFPRVTALAFPGPAKVPFMISWRKYVESYDDDVIRLNVRAQDVRFSYLQTNELLLRRDLMNKQIVDTQGMKVVRVNDLKLSSSADGQLHLLGAEVGLRGILRGIAGGLETLTCGAAKALGKPIPERIIAWSYMDLLDRDISQVKLSVPHKSLDDMHPADIADIIEQLDPKLRTQVFRSLDPDSAAETMSELEDEFQADVIEDLPDAQAARMIAGMDPDDAADIIGELSYEKAEKLLNLMGVKEQGAIRQLLGYPKDTAGGIMTSEFVALSQDATVAQAKEHIRALDDDFEPIYYIYTLDADRKLTGVISMRDMLMAADDARLGDIAFTEIISVAPEDDQQTVASEMTKYSLVDIPVVNDEGKLLGIVTVDDALDVIEEEHEYERELMGGTRGEAVGEAGGGHLSWFLRRELWFVVWTLVSVAALHLLSPAIALPLVAFLPLVLLVADDILSFAASYLIFAEEERPSPAGLIVRDLALGLLMGALGWLIASAALWMGGLPEGLISRGSFTGVLTAAMVTVVLTIASAAGITLWMGQRAEADKPTPGTTTSLVIMLVAAAIFALLAVALCSVMGADAFASL